MDRDKIIAYNDSSIVWHGPYMGQPAVLKVCASQDPLARDPWIGFAGLYC